MSVHLAGHARHRSVAQVSAVLVMMAGGVGCGRSDSWLVVASRPGDADSTDTDPTQRAVLELLGPAVHDFGATRVGSAAGHLFLIQNRGTAAATAVTQAGIGTSAPFAFAGGTFPGTAATCADQGVLAPMEVCSLAITFSPVAAQASDVEVRIGYHDGAASADLSVRLLGRGTAGLKVRRVTTGDRFNCAILTDGTVRCWGSNDFGELGYGDIQYRGGTAALMGAALAAVDLGAGRTVEQLVAGHRSICALLDNHRVKCWGQNAAGELGVGDAVNRGDNAGEMGDALPYAELGTGRLAVSLAAATNSYCALLDNNRVKCWGDNTLGTLGTGDGEHRGDQANEMGDDLPYLDLGVGRNVRQLGGFEEGFCAMFDTGAIKCWGGNERGEQGLGDTVVRGDEPGEMGDNLPVVDLGPGRTVKQLVSSTQHHTCAILDDDSIKCWGLSDFGQLGLGDANNRGDGPGEMGQDLPAVDLGTGRHGRSLILGTSHACALLDDDSLKCWGRNDRGGLGQGDVANRGDGPNEMGDNLLPVALGAGLTAISGDAGTEHTCVVLNDDTLKCWGGNSVGQLGLGDLVLRGDGPGEMGDSLPRVDLGLTP